MKAWNASEDTSALCEVRGWTPAGFYIDNDRSASNGKGRPEWERLLADIKAGKIDAIAAWNQDRSWRLMRELEELREFFTKLDRRILFGTTGQGEIDLYSPDGILQAHIKTAVSEHEVAMLKVRTRRKCLQDAEKGIPKWRSAFGYTTDGTHRPDPITAPLVRQAYADILAGGSLGDVCRLFNDAGALSTRGNPWTPAKVSEFLRNPRNAGLRSHNGKIVGDGTWVPLVDEATWKSALANLDARPHRSGRRTVRKHLLTGVLQCGRCGHHLTGHRNMHGVLSYVCRSCMGIAVRAADVEELTYGLVAGRLAMPDAGDLLQAQVHDEAEAEKIRTELNTLTTRLETIGIERADELLTGKQAKIATDRINEKIAKLEARQQDAKRQQVFANLPLGRPEVAEVLKSLSADRFRAVLDVLATLTVAPAGRGTKVFDPQRIEVDWKWSTTPGRGSVVGC